MAKTIEGSTQPPRKPSIDPEEVAKFSAMAAEWWDPSGKFKPLHKFNPVRLAFVRDTLIEHFNIEPGTHTPLTGLRLLDIGCGGGLVSEPMARLGASVIAVDASEANINTATTHANEHSLEIDYRIGTVEGLLDAGTAPFDVVLNMEVVEHVADPNQFLIDCASLVRPGGLMIVATLNKTMKALATAVIGAEYILGWLPRGTHEWSKFLNPNVVSASLKTGGLSPRPPQGVSYSPITDSWKLSRDTDVNYMIVADRPIT